ncbi:hypothetical protein [Hymenobacter negativus]|uniref:VCBS repeat-containing protein n=1 Tax=Hymenobacter negativus TaxID=2795026 RepID=A0ABS3QNE1_9BACT|nr:hypothetical protein [Hymenobacter negativus]MBO2012794.1 hypothetical protein [Hymenobacter negativus]
MTVLLIRLTLLHFGLLLPVAVCQGQPAAKNNGSSVVLSGPSESSSQRQYAAEDQMALRGVVRRAPGEADTAFLRRLFPLSFSAEDLVSYAWRPSALGKQLFFPRREVNEYRQEGEDAALFVLDPFQPNTYAVQKLLLPSIGDVTNLSAFFFADVDRDGQKELLTLVYAEVQELGTLEHDDGTKERAYARMTQRHTYVFRYAGLNSTGHPRYRADTTPRPYLNGLATAAAVRRALARHQARP